MLMTSQKDYLQTRPKDDPILILLRGIPGSGKSTYAAKLAKHYEKEGVICQIVSTDLFWTSGDPEDEKYLFDNAQGQLAHQWNQARAFRIMRDMRQGVVIIDNTNTTWKEVEPYLRFANLLDFTVFQRLFMVDLETALRRQVHGVPAEIVEKMHARFEHIPMIPEMVGGFPLPGFRQCNYNEDVMEVLRSLLHISQQHSEDGHGYGLDEAQALVETYFSGSKKDLEAGIVKANHFVERWNKQQ